MMGNIAFVAIASIEANLIYKIRVNTASCDDCGMSNTFGALRLQVFNYDFFQLFVLEFLLPIDVERLLFTYTNSFISIDMQLDGRLL